MSDFIVGSENNFIVEIPATVTKTISMNIRGVRVEIPLTADFSNIPKEYHEVALLVFQRITI